MSYKLKRCYSYTQMIHVTSFHHSTPHSTIPVHCSIPPFHSTIPVHHSIPPFHSTESRQPTLIVECNELYGLWFLILCTYGLWLLFFIIIKQNNAFIHYHIVLSVFKMQWPLVHELSCAFYFSVTLMDLQMH